MRKLLYTVAIVMIIVWGIGYFGYNAGALIHMLLFVAIVALVVSLTQDEEGH